MLSTEAALAQGFAVDASLTGYVRVCSFATPRELSGADRTCRIGQVGNAMHVESIAAALMYSLTQIDMADMGESSGSSMGILSRVAKRLRCM